MSRLPAALLATLAVAACHRAAPDDAAVNAAAPGNDGYAARMESLPPGQLNGTLFRAIRDAGRDCQQVTAVTRQAKVQGRPAWTAVCDERTTWLVVLGDDGVATVTSAGNARG